MPEPKSDKYYEVNFDGIPGPTHLFSGLSPGNIASEINEGAESNPKAAAKQSLEKIKLISGLGIKEAIIPPQIRPEMNIVKMLGYQGSRADQLKKLREEDPKTFKAIFSSAFMWTANAAMISPSPDTKDHRLHLTPANLNSNFHRSLEAQPTYKYFRNIFQTNDFKLHSPLSSLILDEGAANHTRLCKAYGEPGIEFFVYGYSNKKALIVLPTKYPARQSLEACEEIAKLHELNPEQIVIAQQNPEAIDAGVFHNDVISTGNLNLFIYHEKAFVNQDEIITQLKSKYQNLNKENLITLEIKEDEIALTDAVSSYLFNSQILSPTTEQMILVCPLECKVNIKIAKYINDKSIGNPNIPINKVHYIDLQESMRNGGGPACLRLRIVMNETQIKNTKQEIFFNEVLYDKLNNWIDRFYSEELTTEMLIDEKFLVELDHAYRELDNIFQF
jgi:succinylarginine dihydrolase